MACRLEHGRQVVLDFLPPASCKDGDDGLGRQTVPLAEFVLCLRIDMAEVVYLFGCRVADIIYSVMVLLLIERHFERQDGEHLFYIPLDGLDAPLLPCPYLRRDVIVDGNVRVLLYKLCNAEVEARIVDEDDDIGLPSHDVRFAHLHVPEDDRQMEQYGNKPHVSQFTVMLHTCAASSGHQVAAKETELGVRVVLSERQHEA